MSFEPPTLEALLKFGLVLGLGAVIGLERERHRAEKLVLAGVRTYPLVSLGGFLAATAAIQLDQPLLVSVGALVAGAFAVLMYWVRQTHGTTGLTSPIALYATYFVGVLVGLDRDWEAIVTGLSIALLLFTSERLHRLAQVMTPQEMEGALYFLILALILYPITPARLPEPWSMLRPQQALLIVLLVSLISFLSFLAIRRWGERFGLPFSGFLGGLVNSEATTVSLANLQRRRTALEATSYAAILLATATMFLRNLVIAGIAEHSFGLVRVMLLPMLAASAVYAGWAIGQLLRDRTPKYEPLQLESPFAFKPAFVFAVWFTVVGIVTVLLTRSDVLGPIGIYVGALGGLVSAGAVVASLGALVATGNADLHAAATTAVLASLLSASNKIVLARVGGTRLAQRLIGPTLVALGVGAGFLLVLLYKPIA